LISASSIRYGTGSYLYLGDLDTTELVRSSDEETPREMNAHEATIMYANKYVAMDNAISTITKKASEVELTEDQLLLCKHMVRGYSLKLKKWRKFNIIVKFGFYTARLTMMTRSGLFGRLDRRHPLEYAGVGKPCVG
jgi:hypothetical protein